MDAQGGFCGARNEKYNRGNNSLALQGNIIATEFCPSSREEAGSEWKRAYFSGIDAADSTHRANLRVRVAHSHNPSLVLN